MEQKSNKGLKVTIVILILLVLGLGGYIAYSQGLFKKDEKKVEENKTEPIETKKEVVLEDYEGLELVEEDYKNTLSIYTNDNKDYFYDEKTEYYNIFYKELKVETKNAKLGDHYKEKYFIVKDNGLKLYDLENNKIYKIKENFKNPKIEISIKDGIFIGFVYYNNYNEENEKSGYYDAINNERKFEGDDKEYISAVEGGYISYSKTRNIDDENSITDSYLMEISTGKEVIKSKDSPCSYFWTKKINKKEVIFEGLSCSGGESLNVYDGNYKEILSEINDSYLWPDEKEIKYLDSETNTLYTLDETGKEKNQNKFDSNLEILQLIKNYIVYVKNSKLYIYDYNKKEEIYLNDWDEDNFYHSMLSGYYGKNELVNENEKEEGIYIVIEFNTFDVVDNGREFYINPKTNKVTTYELEEVGGYAKPILYLYPTKTTDVTVNFEKEEMLTTTYPKFKDSWHVKANPNGDLYDKDGKYYYGLYWEEKENHNISFNEGFYVTKDNAIDFLEEKLTIIGLNDKERNEFIMYWLPILEKNGQSLVYFELTEERENYNKLEITPKPDSMLRMAIHVKKINQKVNIKEQKLTKFNRTGFAAIEWGGVIHK